MMQGLVHVYTGEGKGKTTAALGLGLRAAGCGRKVCMFQFFKDKNFLCGEKEAVKNIKKSFKFKRFDITHPMFKKGGAGNFTGNMKKAMGEVKRAIKSAEYDLVILDEILVGVSQGFIEEGAVLRLMASRPNKTELVLTGRGATKKIIGAADYVTYMKLIKHPFYRGVKARQGIEF